MYTRFFISKLHVWDFMANTFVVYVCLRGKYFSSMHYPFSVFQQRGYFGHTQSDFDEYVAEKRHDFQIRHMPVTWEQTTDQIAKDSMIEFADGMISARNPRDLIKCARLMQNTFANIYYYISDDTSLKLYQLVQHLASYKTFLDGKEIFTTRRSKDE